MITALQDIPTEIMVKILAYLNGLEISNAKLVCKEWYEIIVNLNEFLKRTTLHIQNVILDMDKKLVHELKRQERDYFNLYLFEVTLSEVFPVWPGWEFLGENLQVITLDSCFFVLPAFYNALKFMPNITKLIISRTEYTQNIEDVVQMPKLDNLRILRFRSIYLADVLIEDMIDKFPKLEVLNINHSSYDYKGDRLLEFIKGLVGTLKQLSLSYTKVDSEFLTKLLAIEGLNLTKISLKMCSSLREKCVLELVENQKGLTYLNLESSLVMEDKILPQIGLNLPNLTALKLSTGDVSDLNSKLLCHLSSLKYLKIQNCHNFLKKINFGPYKNHQLKRLDIRSFVLGNEFIKICCNCPNLEYLKIYNSIYEDVAVLRNGLKELNQLKNLNILRLQDLGVDSYVNNLFAEEITSLENLNVLVLTNHNKLKDIFFEHHLPENLHKLDVSHSLITIKGILLIVQKCPKLEDLNVSDCASFDNQCLKEVCVFLKNLQTLNISNCYVITDEGAEYILMYAKRLVSITSHGTRISRSISERLKKKKVGHKNFNSIW